MKIPKTKISPYWKLNIAPKLMTIAKPKHTV